MFNHQADKGFLTFAQNSNSVDYLKLAYLQCKNVKATQKNNLFAVIVDKETNKEVTELHRNTFDYIVELPEDYASEINLKFANEWQSFWLTPFKETVKLESDLLFTRSIDHWWHSFRHKDVVLSTGCKNYLGESSDVRYYRQFFDDNHLPDIYNGLMYFRFSRTALEFFNIAKRVFFNWNDVKEHALLNCREDSPSTDVLYAITAQLFGHEKCTIPSMDFINFVHMKPRIQQWNDEISWQDDVISELDGNMIRVNNVNHYYPFHYYEKTFLRSKEDN